jgi:hypothetical protein
LVEADNVKIRELVIATLKQHPVGLCPREIFEILKDYTKHEIRQVLSAMWEEDHNILGEDRKLRIR